MSLIAGNRDEVLLVALTHRIRCISAPIAEAYFEKTMTPNAAYASRWLRRLESSELLVSRVVFAKQIPFLTRPLVAWFPGEPQPEFGPLSHRLRTRFPFAARSTRIFIATRLAAKRFGGSCERWPRRSEATHDLGLTQVCLELMNRNPERLEGWLSEARLVSRGTRRGEKLPDALIREPDGRETAIEFGGEYGKRKLLAFHADCERKNRGYELW